jgi:hypothetical protein
MNRIHTGVWKTVAAVAVAAASLAALPARAADVPGGVYDCYGPKLAGGPYLDLMMSGAKFSVISPGQYLSREGKTGHFKFDGLTLSMVDGPYAGLKFHKDPQYWSFRMLRETGEEGPFTCPQNLVKDPHKPNAW